MSIAVLTGASAGLGQSFFKSLLTRHPDLDSIWLIARRKERLEEMGEGSPIPVKVLPLDLVDAANYDLLADALKAAGTKVKILINNAGLGELDNVADSTWPVQSRMVDLNCRALTAVTTVVLPYMERGSFIVNVCSIASFCPNPRMTVYSSTKAYVSSFNRGLSVELAPRGIKTTAVCPGPMATEFLDVGGITGNSKTFDTLPYCDPVKVVKGAYAASRAGRAVHTPKGFYKLYRVIAKILPQPLMIKFTKT